MSKGKANQSGVDNKEFPLLSKLVKDRKVIIPIKEIQGLELQAKFILIEELSKYLLKSPEDNIIHIQSLLHLSEDQSITVSKMALLALAEVFKDTVPLYELNEEEIKEQMRQQIPKEERKILTFELAYIDHLRRYLAILKNLLGLKFKEYMKQLNLKDPNEETTKRYQNLCKDYTRCALLCLTDMFSALSHFNFKREMATMITSKLKSKDDEIHNISAKCIQDVFEDANPASFEIKSIIINGMSKIFQGTPEKKLPERFLDVLDTMNMNPAIADEDPEESKEERKQEKKKFQEFKKKIQHLDKERKKAAFKHQSHMKKEVEADLKLAKATVDPKKKGEILKKVFYIYFKVLKQHKLSKFITTTLNGLLKYLHLISHDYIFDLLQALSECGKMLREHHMRNLDKTVDMSGFRVSCIYATLEIVSTLGKVIELDDREALKTMYGLMIDITAHPEIIKSMKIKHLDMVIQSLNKIFLLKRQLSQETCASYIKKILECCAVCDGSQEAIVRVFLFFIKMMFQKYPTLTVMLDPDNEGYGLDAYNPKVDDPQATNSLKTCILKELTAIKKKFVKDTQIQTLSKKVIENEKLPVNWASMTVNEYFKRFGPEQKNNSMTEE